MMNIKKKSCIFSRPSSLENFIFLYFLDLFWNLFLFLFLFLVKATYLLLIDTLSYIIYQ